MPESTRITNIAIEVEGPNTNACIKVIEKWKLGQEAQSNLKLKQVRQTSFSVKGKKRYRVAWTVDGA